MRKLLYIASLLLPLAACNHATEPAALPLRLSASFTSEAPEPLAIVFELLNSGRRPLHVAACDGRPLVAIEREESGLWVNVSAAACPAHLDMAPLTLLPGEQVSGYRPIEQLGRYRALAEGSTRANEPSVVVVSNVVTVSR